MRKRLPIYVPVFNQQALLGIMQHVGTHGIDCWIIFCGIKRVLSSPQLNMVESFKTGILLASE